MDSIIKNDRKQNLKIFQGMERQNSFSKYSGELDQIFGDNCFNKFYTRLLSGRKTKHNYQYQYTDNPNSKYNYNSQSGNFELKNYKKFIHNLKKESELEELKRKEYIKQFKIIKDEDLEKIKERQLSAKKKRNVPEVPSIGWYHPNYSAIRKNEPRIFIGEGYFSRRKNEENNKLHSNHIDLLNDKSEYQSGNVSKLRSRNVSASKREKSDNNNLKTIENNKDNYDNYDYDKRKNNALRFSKYSWRKPIISESITANIVSNSGIKDSFPSENIKGLVEFNKMSSNLNIGSFIPKKSIIPPIGFYKPKYESIETKSPEIYFVKKNPVITKQMRLKKLLYDYNVSKDYELVPTLNS